jgi:hypothetical protein
MLDENTILQWQLNGPDGYEQSAIFVAQLAYAKGLSDAKTIYASQKPAQNSANTVHIINDSQPPEPTTGFSLFGDLK